MPHTVSMVEERAVKTKVRINQVSMVFRRDGNAVKVLNHIGLDVQEGEFVCILGPSGCGKSTLLNIIAGFFRASSGQVAINGEPVIGPDPRRIFVFQERGVFPWLTVEGNIGFGLFRLPQEERASRIAHYIKLVGLARVREVLSARAFRRNEAAPGSGAGSGGQPGHAFSRRAVRRPRLDHAARDAPRAAAHLGS